MLGVVGDDAGEDVGPGGERFVDDINYFVLAETAPNLITYEPFGDRDHWVAPDHFTLTFNHIPGARIRAS